MRTQATNRFAAVVGALAGSLVYFAAPPIDAAGSASLVWLVVCVLGIALAARFCVLGTPAEDRRGLWILNAPLLKRAGSFLLAAGTVIALAFACSYIRQFIQADRCLDRGGRWNHERTECER